MAESHSPESSLHSDNEPGGRWEGGGGGGGYGVREQDRFLPIANVSRIMKLALPANAKISKDAKETIQECVSEFISFITGEASDKCLREKRKTINGDDLLWAMTTLGFEDYVEPLKIYLNRYRELEGEKSSTPKEDKQDLLLPPYSMQLMQQHHVIPPYHQLPSGIDPGNHNTDGGQPRGAY